MNKTKILGICGEYMPSPSANTVCLENVFKELAESGYDCHILCTGDANDDCHIDGVNYHVVKMPNQRNKTLNRINSILHLTSLPQTEANVTRIKLKRSIELQKEYQFDYVIGVCASYANIYAAVQLKKEYPSLKVFGYYLDTIDSLSRLDGLIRIIRDHFSYSGEERVFHELDSIILPISSSKIYESSRYDNYRHKMIYADFPTFIPKSSADYPFSDNKSYINGVIVGTLNSTFRNPQFLFETLRLVCDDNKIRMVIDVYGSNDDRLFDPLKGSSYITYRLHGRVPHDIIDEALVNSDLLINISNSGLLAVPSKIFEYFSSYKPILNQVSDKNDSALNYYRKYYGSFILYTYLSKTNQIDNLKVFLKTLYNKPIDIEMVNEAFICNTPRYVANQFIQLFNK